MGGGVTENVFLNQFMGSHITFKVGIIEHEEISRYFQVMI